MQVREWNPIINWFNERFGVNIQPSRDIGGPSISDTDKGKIQRHLLSYNDWAVHGTYTASSVPYLWFIYEV